MLTIQAVASSKGTKKLIIRNITECRLKTVSSMENMRHLKLASGLPVEVLVADQYGNALHNRTPALTHKVIARLCTKDAKLSVGLEELGSAQEVVAGCAKFSGLSVTKGSLSDGGYEAKGSIRFECEGLDASGELPFVFCDDPKVHQIRHQLDQLEIQISAKDKEITEHAEAQENKQKRKIAEETEVSQKRMKVSKYSESVRNLTTQKLQQLRSSNSSFQEPTPTAGSRLKCLRVWKRMNKDEGFVAMAVELGCIDPFKAQLHGISEPQLPELQKALVHLIGNYEANKLVFISHTAAEEYFTAEDVGDAEALAAMAPEMRAVMKENKQLEGFGGLSLEQRLAMGQTSPSFDLTLKEVGCIGLAADFVEPNPALVLQGRITKTKAKQFLCSLFGNTLLFKTRKEGLEYIKGQTNSPSILCLDDPCRPLYSDGSFTMSVSSHNMSKFGVLGLEESQTKQKLDEFYNLKQQLEEKQLQVDKMKEEIDAMQKKGSALNQTNGQLAEEKTSFEAQLTNALNVLKRRAGDEPTQGVTNKRHKTMTSQ